MAIVAIENEKAEGLASASLTRRHITRIIHLLATTVRWRKAGQRGQENGSGSGYPA